MREKIFSPESLAPQLAARRRKTPSPRIVFTNGVFDLLHVGHLRYLWEARREGDLLIVAINDDASARRLKGSDRPVLGRDDRLQVLAGLACVDYATWFEEDDPIPLLRRLRPDVLVKGGNYGIEGVVGREAALEWGAAVKTLRLTEGRSSTALIEKVLATRKPAG